MSKEVTIGCRLTADIRRDVILQRARLPRVRGTDTNVRVGVYDTILERETSRITSYKGGNHYGKKYWYVCRNVPELKKIVVRFL